MINKSKKENDFRWQYTTKRLMAFNEDMILYLVAVENILLLFSRPSMVASSSETMDE